MCNEEENGAIGLSAHSEVDLCFWLYLTESDRAYNSTISVWFQMNGKFLPTNRLCLMQPETKVPIPIC